jgi:hypothetical protein
VTLLNAIKPEEEIVLSRASSCRPASVFVSVSRKVLVMSKLEEALESITSGSEEVMVVDHELDLESVRRLMAACSAGSSKVMKLELLLCGLDGQAVEVIASSLRSNNVLKWLNLGAQKEIGPRGARALGEMLCVTMGLKSLWIYGCNVGDEGAGHLALALRQNRTLSELTLGDNDIAHVGALALAAALPFNQCAKILLAMMASRHLPKLFFVQACTHCGLVERGLESVDVLLWLRC